jgi:hypothetical protein
MEQLGDGFRQMAFSAQIWVSPQFLSAHSHLNGCCISFLRTVISKTLTLLCWHIRMHMQPDNVLIKHVTAEGADEVVTYAKVCEQMRL